MVMTVLIVIDVVVVCYEYMNMCVYLERVFERRMCMTRYIKSNVREAQRNKLTTITAAHATYKLTGTKTYNRLGHAPGARNSYSQ